MKKIFNILLCLVLAFSLAACSSGSAQEEPEEPQAAPAITAEEQVKLIAESRELWLVTDPGQADQMQYAVADLDDNGRLELIATITEGTGQFTTTQFYEVSEDGLALQPMDYSYGETHSEPDIGWYNSFRCYRGDLGNFLVATDEMRNGYAEQYYVQDFILVREGTVDARSISYCMVLAEDSNGDGEPEMHAYYYASGDEEEELTSAQFASSVDDFFGYAYDRYIVDLQWKRFDAEARDSEVDIPAALAESWQGFGFRKDMMEFSELFVAPSTYYEELYENGAKADIIFGMESLADYWQLLEISTELEARIAPDDNIDSHLIIGQDGMASFYFDDPADARGKVELSDMPLSMAEDGVGSEEGEEGETGEATAEGETQENDWMVQFGSEEGQHRFEATIDAETGQLLVTWYRWEAEDLGADPEVSHLVFVTGVV